MSIVPEATRVAIPLGSAGKTGISCIPAFGQVAVHPLFPLSGQIRECLFIGIKKLSPFLSCFPFLSGLTEMVADLLRH